MSLTEEQEKLIESKILACKIRVSRDITDALCEIQKVADEVDILKEGHFELRDTLSMHEKQRAEFNGALKSDMMELKKWFEVHDAKDTDKYDTIIKSLAELSDVVLALNSKTDDNTDFIYKLRKNMFRTTSIAIGIVGTLSAMYWAYNFLQKHGFVFVLEKAQ